PPTTPPEKRSGRVLPPIVPPRPRRPATTTKTAARRSRPPPGRNPAPSHDRVPTTTRIRHSPHRCPTPSPPKKPRDPDTKRTDAPAAPIPTAAPTHRPTPHAPHPRAPSRRPTRNPPPPTRHRRSHSASPPPPLILPADRHPPAGFSDYVRTSPPTTPSRGTDAACRAQLRLRAGGPRQLPPIVEGRRPTRAPRQLSLDFATHSPTTSGHRHLSLDRTNTPVSS